MKATQGLTLSRSKIFFPLGTNNNSKTQKQTSTFLDYNKGLWKLFNPHIYMQEGTSYSFYMFKMKDFFKQKYYDTHLGLMQLIPKTKDILNPISKLQKKWTWVSAHRSYTIPLQAYFTVSFSDCFQWEVPTYCQTAAKSRYLRSFPLPSPTFTIVFKTGSWRHFYSFLVL